MDFDLDWDDFKVGFGSPGHEIWLGNEQIYSLTNQRRYQLRIDLVDADGDPYYAKYGFFRINNEANNYRLTVENYAAGDAGKLELFCTVCITLGINIQIIAIMQR